MQNGAFTEILENKFKKDIKNNYVPNFIDEFAEGDENEYKFGLLKELNEKRNAITFGYALKRFICEKYCTYRESDKKYISSVVDDDNNNFLLEDYNTNDSNEGYKKLIIHLRKESGVIEKDATAKNIDDWLKAQHNNISRDVVFRLAFILKMNNIETEKFLTKVIFDHNYNFRDAEEIVYYYCHAHNLTLNDAKNLLKQYEGLNIKIKNENTNNDVQDITVGIQEEVSKINTEEELIKYLNINKNKFSEYRVSLKKEYDELLDDIKSLLALENELENILEDKENDKKRTTKDKENNKKRKTKNEITENYIETRLFSWRPCEKSDSNKITKPKALSESVLSKDIINDLPNKIVMKKIRDGKPIKRKVILYLRYYKSSLLFSISNYISSICMPEAINGYLGEDLENIQKRFLELVENNFEQIKELISEDEKKSITKLIKAFSIIEEKMKAEHEKIKKKNLIYGYEDLIYGYMEADLLNILLQSDECSEECREKLSEVLEKRLEEFREETDDKLGELRMGKMYLRNEFDKLILISMASLNPYEFFSDILEKSFEK